MRGAPDLAAHHPPPESVVFLGHTAAVSGGEIGLTHLISGLGDVHTTVILAQDGPLVKNLRAAGADVEVLELEPAVQSMRREQLRSTATMLTSVSTVWSYALRLSRRLRVLKPDLVHTNTLKAGVYGVLAARMARLPVIWGLHDRLTPDYLPSRAVTPMRLLVKETPSGVIVPSRATLAALGDGFRPGLQRAIIPLPVPAPRADHRVRARVGCVGLIGRITAWKGQDVFLRAFARAFPAGPVRARIVGTALFGEDAYAASLRDLAASLGIADRVEFRGFQTDIAAELADIDVLVSASVLPETLGQAIIEGMGAGVPTIAPRAGGPLEYMTDGENGLFHTPGDVGDLAEALNRLSTDFALRQRLGDNGPQIAEQFSTTAVGCRMLDFYGRVIHSDRGGRR